MIINKKRYTGLQVYKVKGRQEYMYVFEDTANVGRIGLQYDACATLTDAETLPSCHTVVADNYLRENCRPMSYKKLPFEVQSHLTNYVSQ